MYRRNTSHISSQKKKITKASLKELGETETVVTERQTWHQGPLVAAAAV